MNKILSCLIFFSFLITQTVPDMRVVAEWEPALGTIIRWPLGIPSDLVVELARDDIVYVLIETNNQQNQAMNSFNNWGVNSENILFINTDTYSHWTRDHGPQFIIGQNNWQVINQQFNGYPEESGCQENSRIPDQYEVKGRPLSYELRGWEEDDNTNIDFAIQMNWDIKNIPLYLTGGNFMTDGYGMGFSTQLMVNENNINNTEFQQIVSDQLHLFNYHIFDNPNISSIQHIDCLAKLVNPETIIIKQVAESSPEYDCIEDFAQSFYELNTFYDRPFKIHRIYCPEINGGWWELNPVAAYTNSLILNNKVLVPQYGIFSDVNALRVYEEAMPGYEIIGFDNNTGNPWLGEDALHCRTMGVFDPDMLHISHKSIRTDELVRNNNIYIEADVIDYSSSQIESVFVFWKYSSEDGPFNSFELQYISDYTFSGSFPNLNPSSEIQYYIHSKNFSASTINHPIHGWHKFITSDQLLGDVNGDGQINVIDVVMTVNIILGPLDFNQNIDLNNDGIINVIDVIQLINLILS